jgi:plastocyanin
MRHGVLIVAVLALGAVPLLAGCGSSSSSSSGGSTSTRSSSEGGGKKVIAGVKANNHGSKDVSRGGKTKVELDDFYFEPTVLQGKAGEKVNLELENEGKVDHTFTIDSGGIDKTLAPGDEAEVTVTIPKSGVVSFYCRFHKSSGMAGALAAGGSGGMSGSGRTRDNSKNNSKGSYDGY